MRQKTSETVENKNNLQRFARIDVRAEEGGENSPQSFEISFSSEEPYNRWFGPEILDHSDAAIDLTRLNEIGVLLYNHDRDAVIGKITRAWVEDNRGKATIEFDSDEASETIRRKVESGTLKGVSVGYSVTNWEDVEAGETSIDGRFTGPCSIARRWMPYEVSIVSVPADATVGVGREYDEQQPEAPATKSADLSIYERQIQINSNL